MGKEELKELLMDKLKDNPNYLKEKIKILKDKILLNKVSGLKYPKEEGELLNMFMEIEKDFGVK
jgi:hypothetical protein